jgi:hypothetical protein
MTIFTSVLNTLKIGGGRFMYQYFNGLVIREGTEGVPADGVEAWI